MQYNVGAVMGVRKGVANSNLLTGNKFSEQKSQPDTIERHNKVMPVFLLLPFFGE